MKTTYVITPMFDFDSMRKQLFLSNRAKFTDITEEVRDEDQKGERWNDFIVALIEEEEVVIPAISDIRVFIVFPGYGEIKLSPEASKMTACVFSQVFLHWEHSKLRGQELLLSTGVKSKSGKVDFEIMEKWTKITQLFQQLLEKRALLVHWMQDVQIASMGGVIEVGVKPQPDESAPKLPPPETTKE